MQRAYHKLKSHRFLAPALIALGAEQDGFVLEHFEDAAQLGEPAVSQSSFGVVTDLRVGD